MKASHSSVLLLLAAGCGARAGAVSGGHEPAVVRGDADEVRGAPALEWRGPARQDWLSWRGPHQDGSSDDSCPPVAIDPEAPLWSVPLSGRGTPVIADGLVYAMAYEGEGASCVEMIVCLDERDGSIVWRELFPDFLSDVVYSRYGLSSPVVDPETGNVYCHSSPGQVVGYTRAGKRLWEHSLMEEYGKLTFPNGRIGAPIVVGDAVIVHAVNVGWGPQAPARDRVFAFDKRTGESLWVSQPGEGPQDNSFSTPVVLEQGGRPVVAFLESSGYLAGLDARTGDPLWRHRIGSGGIGSPVVHHGPDGDTLIGIHGNENLDDSTIGRMVAVRLGALPGPGDAKPVELGPDAERWRAEIEAFSSSPVLAGERLYQTDEDGVLHCVDVTSGKTLWHEKLAADQVHASPLFAEGKLYVPMNNGSFYVLRPTDEGVEVLDHDQLAGNCLGAPALSNLKLYVHTTERLYCFGAGTSERREPLPPAAAPGTPGPAVRLQVIPADFQVEVGKGFGLRARTLDAQGRVVADPAPGVTFTSELPLREEAPGRWTSARDARAGAGLVQAALGDLKASARVRLAPALPYREDFEGVKLEPPKPDSAETDAVGAPPSFWLSGRAKWDVRERDGSKVAARTIDNPLFQRTMSLFGDPEDSGYTFQADVMVEGNRRGMASVGLVNQRYLVQLRGNYQDLEISSNFESLKVGTPFPFRAETWYTLKTRVDLLPNGATIVRAKCWERGTEEPRAWTLEVPHEHGHRNGAAGLFGFTLQNRFRAYVDNLSVTPNE